MSAIWGMVDFYNESGNEDLAKRMETPYHTYKIDRYKNYVGKNEVLGYGGQHFTVEASNEIQPITNVKDNALFVADVVLDNREELFDLLGVKSQEQSQIADGTLMYQILRRYGRDSFNLFLGTYAFAYYDKYKKEVLLVADVLGSRSLYYCYERGRLYFSTLIKPILEAREEKTELNYRFLSDYLALDNLALTTEAEETPYLNLYKVAPGQVISIKELGLIKEDYWNPPSKADLLKKSDEDFKKDFINLFEHSVASVMRSNEKTGILLSGGLDSTSVACFAAPKLKAKGELLYSYTSIPEKEYVSKESPYYNTDEQKMVEITKEYLGSISSTFLELSGENGFDCAAECMAWYELPYKSLQNINWMYESAKQAAKDGCRILLTGQYGNLTISFGEFDVHFYSLIMAGRLIELFKEVNAFHNNYHIARKKIYRILLKKGFSGFFSHKSKEDMFSKVYVNPKLLEQYQTKKRFVHSNDNKSVKAFTFHQTRPYMYNKKALIQIGELETHLSLYTGVLLRDPTKDKRIVEFCMKLPANQFVNRGVERRLVREYLESYLPTEIILDKHRGLQSADMMNRISKNWANIYQECTSLLEEDAAGMLLDTTKIMDKMKLYKEKLPENSDFEILRILYSVLLVKYCKIQNILQNC